MTREEAIVVLKNEQPHCGEKALFSEGKRYEAFDMAIKALEMTETHNMIEKGVLKQRGEGYVYYDINWLKKWWRHEMEILGINTWE